WSYTFVLIVFLFFLFLLILLLPISTLFPYTTLFRSLSPLRRGLAIDSTVDIFTFYVPHRHVYGEQWIKFMKDGVNALFTINVTKIGRAVQQECRDRSRMPSSA